MSFTQFTELNQFLSTYISESDADQDLKSVAGFLASSTAVNQARVGEQIQIAMSSQSLVEDLGMAANRWFGSSEEAQEWLQELLVSLSQSGGAGSVAVKDSNGAELKEGDAVTVIKDLKVKGGSSDLKRGTLIKKIRLIGDPANIECNVDGSTLVLKTIFLKKA